MIPFTVYAKIAPDRKYNQRRTYTNSMEKIARIVAMDIEKYITDNPDEININCQQSVSVRPQFAQYPAQLTITGWDIVDSPIMPYSKIRVDAPYTSPDENYDGDPGKYVEGYQGTQYLHPQGQTLDPSFVTLMSNLKTKLESASVYLSDITRIDYAGVTFGQGGHSFGA